MTYYMKSRFRERMLNLIPDKSDFEKFEKILYREPRSFIRCNTLKISTDKLLVKLNKKWKVVQPFLKFPEIMLVENDLMPGELGRAIEHVLGYYYIQEISSMLSVLALDPKPGEIVLDLAAAPGSKTTQIAARMDNKGTLIANDPNLGRIRILAANLNRCGVANTIITRKDGMGLCNRLYKAGFRFDKILLDAPCSGEGTLRTSPKTFLRWNEKVIKIFSKNQKRLIEAAIKCLKVNGELVYSTCTHAPEENESVVNFALENFPVELEVITLPLKCREGITYWEGENFSPEVKKVCRIYPQDNDSEGFFVSKLKLKGDIKK